MGNEYKKLVENYNSTILINCSQEIDYKFVNEALILLLCY